MKPTYEEIVTWMKEYFNAYNAYAQDSETVIRMADYFTSDVQFVPYVSDFGGPGNAVTNRSDFFRMFTGHPTVYEKFDVDDVMVDEKRMIVVALLDVSLCESKTGAVLLRKHYQPQYQLVMDDENTLKISRILFFWEAMPPEVEALYAIEKREK